MSSRLAIAALLLALWSAWLCFAQGALAQWVGPGACAPELTLLVLYAIGVRGEPRAFLLPALVVAGTRAAFGIEPPLVVLSGMLGAALCFHWLRAWMDLADPLLLALFAGCAQAALGAWWRLALVLRLERSGQGLGGVSLELGAWLVSALLAGLLCLALSPMLARLPGLRPLLRVRA